MLEIDETVFSKVQFENLDKTRQETLAYLYRYYNNLEDDDEEELHIPVYIFDKVTGIRLIEFDIDDELLLSKDDDGLSKTILINVMPDGFNQR